MLVQVVCLHQYKVEVAFYFYLLLEVLQYWHIERVFNPIICFWKVINVNLKKKNLMDLPYLHSNLIVILSVHTPCCLLLPLHAFSSLVQSLQQQKLSLTLHFTAQ